MTFSPAVPPLHKARSSVVYPADGLSLPLTWGVSLAKLRQTYSGSCVKLTRASDAAQADIGFDGNGDVDATAIASHQGVSSVSAAIWYDQAASANAIQATTAAQPSCSVEPVSGKYMLAGDGTAKAMETSANVNCSGQSAVTLVLGLRNVVRTGYQVLIEQWTAANNWNVSATFGSLINLGAQLQSDTSNYLQNRTPNLPDQARNYVLTCIFRPLGANNTLQCELRIDGAGVAETNNASSGTLTGNAFINGKIQLFARSLSSFFSNVAFHTAMLFNGELNSTDLAKVEGWLYGKIHNYTDIPTDYDNSRNIFVQSGSIPSTSPHATATYDTLATKIGVQTHVAYATSAGKVFGVYVNGAFNQQVPTSQSSGLGQTVVTLPSGMKRLTIAGGPANWPGAGNIEGINLQNFEANALISRVTVSDTNRLTILGDSISVGANATVICSESWAMLLRLYGVIPVSVEAYGFRALYEEAVDAAAITASVARLVEHTPTNIVIALGTNDYNRNVWTAATFGTQYAALLVAINTALPGARIYAQTPLLRTTETANGLGSTLGDYRSAIATAASGKAYVTLVDGTTILTLGDLDDGVHPTTAGHAKIFAFYKTLLGI